MAATEDSSSSPMCNLAILDSLSEKSNRDMMDSWNVFCISTEALIGGDGNLYFASDFVPHLRNLCNRGLQSLVVEHFLRSVEVLFYFHLLTAIGNIFHLYFDKGIWYCLG